MRKGTTDRIAFKHFRPKFMDLAAEAGRANSIDGFGLLWAIMTAAEFQAAYGAAPQPHANPGIAGANGQTAVALAQWKFNNDAVDKQSAALEQLRNSWLTSIFPHLLKPMEVDRSLRTRTLLYMFTTLSAQLAVFKQEDFDWLNRQLKVPYKLGEDVPAFLAQKLEYLTDLAEAGQASNNMDAVSLLQSLFPARLYQLCWQEYAKDHGRIENRTPANLCAFIIEYADQRLQHAVGHSALAAEELSPHLTPPTAAVALAATETDLVGTFLALLAANPAAANAALRTIATPAAAAAPTRIKFKKTGAPPAAAAAPPPAGRPRPYCHSCGVPALAKHQHYSTGCLTPKPGHNYDATFLNQMGGKSA